MDKNEGDSPARPAATADSMLGSLVEQMPAIVWTVDRDLKFLSSTGGGLAALGQKPAQFAGVTLFEYFRTEDPDFPPIAAHRRALEGESVSYTLRWSDLSYSSHLEPMRDSSGAITGVIGIAFDVTDRVEAQEGLERSLALLRATLDSTADGILVVDDGGKIITWNNRFVEMWGMPHDVVAARDSSRTMTWVLDQLEDPARFVTQTMGHYAHMEQEGEDILRFKDGRVFERYSPAGDGPTPVLRARVWSFRDITARVRADEERSHSLSLLEATLESTADGLLVVDDAGHIVKFNRKFVDMWRIPDSILTSRDDARAMAFVLDQLKAPDAFVRKVKDLYASPESQSFDWLEFKDGRLFERYSQPQRVGGRTVGRVWSFRDVTDRVRMEEILRRQARTFEHMFDGVVVTDLSGRILDCNPGAEKMFGYGREALTGKMAELLVSPAEERDRTQKMLDGVRRDGRWTGSLRFRRQDGSRGISETVVVPHSDDFGRLVAAIFIHRDVTASRELERRLRELDVLDDTGMGRG